MSKISDTELRLIYKAYAAGRLRVRGYDEATIDDVASEMYAIALWRENRKDISRFNMTVRWLYCDAIKLVFGFDEIPKSWKTYVALCEGLDQDTVRELLMTYCGDTRGYGTNIKNAKSLMVRELKRYTITVNGKPTEKLNCEEIVELLNKRHINLSPSQIVDNLRKRGKRLWLIEGRLWETVQEFSRAVGLSTKTARKRYSILPMKIGVMGEARLN